MFDQMTSDPSLKLARTEAINWMLMVGERYGFSASTVVLAVNYYDRFMAIRCSVKDEPWMNQLAAVVCLLIAAKVEETEAPGILNLQVEETKYAFEGKMIQRMKLWVLSTLDWNMNLVTPMSFIDHIARRFASAKNLHLEFYRLALT